MPLAPNSRQDQTRKLQSYIDSGDTAPLAPGTYQISDTLFINRKRGFRFEGYGGLARSESARGRWEGVVLEWKGPPDKPMIKCIGTTGLVMRGINLFGDAEVGIQIEHGEGNLDLKFADFGIVGPKIGIQAGARKGDATCANITYDNLYWNTKTGVRIVGKHSVRHLFIAPTFTWCHICIDMWRGGSVQVYGGGSYDADTLLRLGDISANTRSFLVEGFDFDAQSDDTPKRTQWLGFTEPSELATYGVITFSQCTQNKNQKDSDKPLIEVAPGAVVNCRDCTFHPESLTDGSLAHVWAIDHNVWDNPHGEFNVYCGSNLWPGHIENYVTLKGNGKGRFRLLDCGSRYGDTKSLSNWPGEEGGGPIDETPPNEAIENLQRSVISLQDMVNRQDERLGRLELRDDSHTGAIRRVQRQLEALETNDGSGGDESTQRQITVLKDSLENLVRRLDQMQVGVAGHESRLNGHRGDIDALQVDHGMTVKRLKAACKALKGEGDE